MSLAFTFDRHRGVFYTHGAFSPFARIRLCHAGANPHGTNGAVGHFAIGGSPFDLVLVGFDDGAQVSFRMPRNDRRI